MDDHSHHDTNSGNGREYAKLAGVIAFITLLALFLTSRQGWGIMTFLEYFMGSFFLVFAFFKVLNLKMFAHGFSSYDVVARKSIAYAYLYPFIQATFAVVYLTRRGAVWLDVIVLAISLISSIGVLREMGSKIKCACLGNFINLPLTKISFVEDFGMALMALAMIFLR